MRSHDSRSERKQPVTKSETETSSRHYASFLLRLWFTKSNNSEESPNELAVQLPLEVTAIADEQEESNLVLQVQHLQTGVIWRVTTLAELNKLLMLAVKDENDVTINQKQENQVIEE